MSATARARKRRTIQEQITALQAKVAVQKKRADLRETIEHAKKELSALRLKK